MEIKNAFKTNIIRHILNSAGIERFPEYQYDMSRLGIGLYGVSAENSNKLENVTTLKTKISQVKNLSAGNTVGYGRKGVLKQDSQIAVISIGYADGLRRKLSNGVGKVLINGKFAPIVGNICMDMCMIDVTGIKAKAGDDVIIFGKDYPVTEIAKLLDTIPYEIMTSISSRVKKVYYQE